MSKYIDYDLNKQVMTKINKTSHVMAHSYQVCLYEWIQHTLFVPNSQMYLL